MHHIALCAVDIGTGNLPARIPLIPAGKVIGRDGRSWTNDSPVAVLAHFEAQGMDIPIDIEHATELKAPKGEPAPAAGWIKSLNVEDSAIYGLVEWNELGQELVGGKQYRYISPVILYKPGSNQIAGITSVALTNRPNLHLAALNQSQGREELPEEESMLLALLAALGLPENATKEQAMAKITGLSAELQTAKNQAESPSLEKFVPRGDYDQALARATNAEQQLTAVNEAKREGDIQAAIDKALAEGKITPATVDYHKAQCRQEGGLERFAQYCDAAPAIGDLSGLDHKTPGEKQQVITADQKAICAQLGITEEEFLKTAI